jgi:glutathionylspermidine synthase
MERLSVAPRAGWQAIVEEQGLIWHTDGRDPYWDESAAYAFPLAEIEMLEEASEEVYRLFVAAGNAIIDRPELLALFNIPAYCHDAIRSSWRHRPPALEFGRFDFGYDGRSAPKLFEFNCDTPTALLEAAVVQWYWKEYRFPDCDQWNSLHERLIDRWTTIKPLLFEQRLWVTHIADPAHEDTITTTYMRDLAAQAGIETHGVLVDRIGVDANGRPVDDEDQLITAIFKLYPWEWLTAEEFGPAIVRNLHETDWIEPIWKMIWSHKAILKILWDLFPDHPNLLRASFDKSDLGASHVAKPVLAREGSNIVITADHRRIAETRGPYRDGPVIYQQLYPMRDFGRGYPVLGCWIVGGVAAGMGIREDGLITGNRARFVPHIIRG